MTNQFKSNPDRCWVHWFDGLREAMGIIGLVAYGLSVGLFFIIALNVLIFPIGPDDKFHKFLSGGGVPVELKIAAMAIAGTVAMLSIGGCVLCFRAYPRFVRIFLLLQVPIFMLELICCVLIFLFVL
jgi:hypothetical protein